MPVLDFVDEELARLEGVSLLRRPTVLPDRFLDLCSNDYLGLAREPLPAWRGGAGASGLVTGYREEHRLAERALADWLRTSSALLFSSGFAANSGTIGALVGRGDLVVSDALNHASIVDGCRLSRAEVAVVPHLDVAAVDAVLSARRPSARRCLVVTESYFSMDADTPDLAALAAVCRRHDAIFMVDEAHALGVFGPEGRGFCADVGVEPDIRVGTLGKSFGLQGAFVFASEPVCLLLWNRARSLVFSTALSPALAADVPRRVEMIRTGDALRRAVLRNAELVRGALLGAGVRALGTGPIIPWVLGSPETAIGAQASLAEEGIWAGAIRPPTVPVGSSRIRMTVSARFGLDEIGRVESALGRVVASVSRET